MHYNKSYRFWSENEYFSEDTRRELLAIEDQKEIEDRFYKELEFGTGGLRGIVSAGTNRLNIYTIRKASQGVADYINKSEFPSNVKGIAIAYDSRRMSRQFAMEAACVFAANNIKAYLFKELMPTPVLSFAVRQLHCSVGIVITASHNPKEYNGYKVYGMDGGQITDALAHELSEYICKVEPITSVRTMEFEKALSKGIISFIEDDLLNSYVKNVIGLSGKVSSDAKEALKIVYSPLHGTGLKPVTQVLKEAGFTNLHVVKEQSIPDTEFSTVKSPNPEDHEALSMAIEEAKSIGADIVIATDPDSDRLGIAINNNGNFEYLNGNQLGCILLDTALKQRMESGNISADDYIVKTIVTTRMADVIAEKYSVRVVDVLTGFKYIGETITKNEGGKGDFLFGFEESYGYLAGTFVRDKDAIIAALYTCEASAYYKKKGYTLIDALNDLFEQYGYYRESLKSYILPGKDGVAKIKYFMDKMRNDTPSLICGRKVIAISDFFYSKRISGEGTEDINLPKSNVLLYDLDNGAWLAIRPSGTEPKLKIYMGVKGASAADCAEQVKKLEAESDNMVARLTD